VMALLMNPLVMRLGAAAVACIALFGFGWYQGSSHVQKRWDSQKQSDASHLLSTQQKQAEATVQVVTDYTVKQNEIKEKSDAVAKQVPSYMSGVDCHAAGRIGLLINSATSGVQLPQTPADSDVPAETATDIAGWSVETIEAFKQNAEQLSALQAWIKQMQEAK
jgi:hypothetical protein